MKTLVLFLTLFGLVSSTQAQLIVDSDDLLATHKNYIYGSDTVLVQLSDLQKTGDHQKWDFSLLSFLQPDTVVIRTTISEKNPIDVFYAIYSSSSKSTAYLKKNRASLNTEAYEFKDKTNGTMRLDFSVPEKVLEFPLYLGKKYYDSAVAEMKIKSPYKNYDSIRVSTTILRSSMVEAGGSLLLPSGENHKVLKIKVSEKQIQYSFLKKGNEWINSDTLYDERINYSWIGKNTGYLVMKNEVVLNTGKITTSYLNSTFVSSGGAAESGVTIFPNPARDYLSVSLQGYEGTVLLEVLDVNSVPALTKSYNTKEALFSLQLELPSLQPGPYHLRVRDGKKTSLTKFVIVR